MKPRQFVLAATALAVTVAAAEPAQAVLRIRVPAAHATAYCQPALPAFDGLVRKRPLAVQNEGSTTAFITCSIPIDLEGDLLSFVMGIVNNTAGSLSISCTLVQGLNSQVSYTTRTAVAAPGYSTQIYGDLASNDASSFSCALPPGTGINSFQAAFTVDVSN